MRCALRPALWLAALALPGGCRAAGIPAPIEVAVPVPGAREVDTGFWRGPQPDADGFRSLAARGFRTVVNLRLLHSDADDLADAGVDLDLVEIPLAAHLASTPPTPDEARRFLDVVADPARRPVYVHCAHGVDRTGVMVAVYRMEVQGWSHEDALEEMHAAGFHRAYVDLESFVRRYRRGYPSRGTP